MRIRNLSFILVASSLGGCSFFESYNYDDYSLYQYDEPNNYGVGIYQSHDYQDDYYGGSPFQNHMRIRQSIEYERQ